MDRVWVYISPSSLISGISGSEEFLYLLLSVLYQYGHLIMSGMYEHACHLGSQVNGVIRSSSPQPQTQSQAESSQQGQTQPEPPDQQTQSIDSPSKDEQQDTQPTEDAQTAFRCDKHDKPTDNKRSRHANTLPNIQNVGAGASHGRDANDKRASNTNDKARPTQDKTGWPPKNKDDDNIDEEEKALMKAIRGMKLDLGGEITGANENDDTLYKMSDIAGLGDVKEALEEFACIFLHFPHLTRQLKQRSSTGLLLFGPQGTGKTLLVRSFARQYNLALYDIRASAVLSKYVGEAEKFVRALFRQVRKDAPAILLLDECDGLLARARGGGGDGGTGLQLLQNELKNQWSDLIYSRAEVLVVGATNKPHDIDLDGFGRRLALKLHIDLPGGRACRQVLEAALGKMRHAVGTNGGSGERSENQDQEEMEVLGHLCAERCLSGYDIHCLVEGLLRRALRSITRSTHFRVSSWDGKPTMVPCKPDDEGARRGSWKTIMLEDDVVGELSYVPFSFGDVHAAILRAQPTVDEQMRAKHRAFAAIHSPRRDDDGEDDD